MTSNNPTILVAGGGIAGGVFAQILLRGLPNAKITILERSPKPRLTGASVDIRSSAVDVIKWMGLEKEIRANTTKEEGMDFIRADGSSIATLWATGRDDIQSATSEYEIFRGKLAEIFLAPVMNRAEMIFDEYVEKFEELEDGVQVTLKNSQVTRKFDLLVGADGFRSKTRVQMLGTDPNEQIHNDGCHVAYFTIKKDLLNGSKLAKWFNDTDGRGVFVRPDPRGYVRGHFINVTWPSEVEKRKRLDDALLEGNDAYMRLLEEEFKDAGWLSQEVLKGMRESDDFYASLFCQIWSPRFVSKRVALLGDAGYATPGIGTSLAIVGGYVLAGELCKVYKGIDADYDIPSALHTYEKFMRPFVKSCQSDNNAQQYLNPQTWWGLKIRNAVLWTIGTFRLDKLAMMAFGWVDQKVPLPDYEWPPLEDSKL